MSVPRFLLSTVHNLEWLLRFRSERGVTTVEYAIMLVLIAIAVAGSSPGVRDAIINTFDQAANTLNTAGS